MTDIINFQLQNETNEQTDTRFQYLLDPKVSNVFLVIDIILFMPLCALHYLMLRMIRRESRLKKGQNLIKNLLITNLFIVVVYYTFIGAYYNVLTRYERTPEFLRGHWFCVTFELYVHHTTLYMGCFSLFIAMMRYWRIVHNQNASEIVEAKVRNIIFIIHLVCPVVLSVLNSWSNGRIDQLFIVDHCWSFDSVTESLSVLNSEKLKDFFCTSRQYEATNYFEERHKKTITLILQMICGSLKIAYILVLSNVVEFILYFQIYGFLNR